MNMMWTQSVSPMTAVLAGMVLLTMPGVRTGLDARAAEEGIALAIVYDTSGSMADPVPDGAGRRSPKYQIANRALTAIIDRLQAVARSSPQDSPRKIETGLFTFRDHHCVPAVPFGPLDAPALRGWLKKFSGPQGSTPLGESLQVAGKTVLASSLARKHILVITDGINTAGPDPASTWPRVLAQAAEKGGAVSVHFVAFDVAVIPEPASALLLALGAALFLKRRARV